MSADVRSGGESAFAEAPADRRSPGGGSSAPQLERRISVWPGRWAVCRLPPDAAIPAWALEPSRLTVVARTDEELSIVAPEPDVPREGRIERGFRVLAMKGPIPFSVTGVIASLAVPLAEAGVSLFPIATYDTDYVLVKDADLERALAALGAGGWEVESFQVSE
jgi:hypothetical protein